MDMAVSKAKRAANDKWDKEHMKVVACKIKKDRAELFRELCERDGKTANAVLTELIEEYIATHEGGNAAMKHYRVLPEYIDQWTHEALDELTVNEAEIKRLSREWGTPLADLMEQVEEIDGEIASNFEAAVELMDDELREQVHADLAPCSNEEFLREYERRHFEKYGEEFKI